MNQPPPPMKATARVNGRSRVQKLNPTESALAEERHLHVGAERDVREAEDADRERSAARGVKPAVRPCGVDLEVAADRENPSNGMRSLIVSTKVSSADELDLAEDDVDLGLARSSPRRTRCARTAPA